MARVKADDQLTEGDFLAALAEAYIAKDREEGEFTVYEFIAQYFTPRGKRMGREVTRELLNEQVRQGLLTTRFARVDGKRSQVWKRVEADGAKGKGKGRAG